MASLLKYVLRRLLAIPITLILITAVLYGIVMIAPAEDRAQLYWPPRTPPYLSPEAAQNVINRIIEENHLDESYPRQYLNWAGNLLKGDWGWSPALGGDVLEALLRRTPVTAELTLFSVLMLVPIGLVSGLAAGWRQQSRGDHIFRLAAFVATSIPPFILGLFLLSIFYVGLHWFPPGRTALTELSMSTSTFKFYTGMLTIDGLLNGRLDVVVDAARHLVLPVFTLSLAHWATLARVTRAAVIDEKPREYVTAARAKGLRPRMVLWRHAFRNVLVPALTSTALSAASLVTGVFVVEVIFGLKGVSTLITHGFRGAPDAPLAMGFAVYSVLLIMPLMIALDVLKAVVDPRQREEEVVVSRW